MDKYQKIIEKFFKESKTQKDLHHFLDYVYSIMFTSYYQKVVSETRKRYYIHERQIRDNSVVIDDIIDILKTDDLESGTLNFEQNIESESLLLALSEITDKQKIVLYDYYINERNETKIAKKLGVTKQAVNRIRKRAIQSIKILIEPPNKYK